MHGRRLAVRRTTIVAIACAALCVPAVLAGDGLYYKEENGTVVFTNVGATGLLPVPGFSSRDRLVAAVALPATRHDGYIQLLAGEVGVSADLIKAVAMVESGFDPLARSPKGALGLMQLMPATARKHGVENPLDPWQNLRGGAAHLSELLERYDGDLVLTLAAYNAGSGAVERYRGVPPFRETRDYVRKVRELLDGKASGLVRPSAPARRQASAAPLRVARAADGTITLSN